MKNLLIINQFACLPENMFAPGERMYHLSKYFHEKGYNITIISGSYNHLYKNPPEVSKVFTEQVFPFGKFVWIKLRKYNKNRFIGRLISWFEFLMKLFFFRFKNKPDIVLVSSLSLLPVIYASFLKIKFRELKFVFEIRDIWPLTAIEIGGYSKYNPLIFLLRKIELFGYKKADHIVSVLPGFKKYLIENNFSNKKFTWIANGVEPPNEEKIIQEITITEEDIDSFDLYYTGAIGDVNALEFLIEAARLTKDNKIIKYHIVGDGPRKTYLQELANGLSNVFFYEKVTRNEVNEILKRANAVFIGAYDKCIYKYGVAANKFNDYMLARKPIISSSNIDDDPVLISKSGIQVRAESPEDIARAIIDFSQRPSRELEEMGDNGYNFIINNQIYPVLAVKYLKVFED